MKEAWKKFNGQQLKAVTTVNGVVRIGSVAGSGKTTVLVNRVEHMVNDLNIDPKKIAMMTFTAKAAENMQERLEKLMGKGKMAGMFCGTSHSFGYKILSTEFKEMNHPLRTFTRNDKGNPGVLTGSWQRSLAEDVKKEILKEYNENSDIHKKIKETSVKSFLFFVTLAKNNNKDHVQVESEMAMGANEEKWAYINFYRLYEKKKFERKAIDFDDMLFLAVRLLVDHPEVASKYQRMFEYILTDESQDNNILQYMMVNIIGAPEYNLFFVGDDDQSMYGFRGANPDSFIHLAKQYSEVIDIPLEDNYRSYPDILDRANRLIAHNTNRIVKQLKANKKDDQKAVFFSKFNDEVGESEWVAKEIKSIIEGQDTDFTDSISYKQVAILYRTNAQSKEMEDALITYGIPYVIHGGYSFYERKEVKDILAYLSLAVNPDDNDSFKRIYNTPTRYLGKAFLEKVSKTKGSFYRNLNNIERTLTTREQNAVFNLKMMVSDMSKFLDVGTPIEEVIDYLMDNGYREYLADKNDSQDDEEATENEIVEKLKFFVQRFNNVKELFDYVELMTSKKKEDVNGVQLMTIHRSKGLEFNAVFGIGLNENLLPHYRSIEAAESGEKPLAVEEERRLAYVLVTRGECNVHLSSTYSFNGKDQETSRFISEMGLLENDDVNEEKDCNQQEKIEETGINSLVEEIVIGILHDIPDLNNSEEKVEFDKNDKRQEEKEEQPKQTEDSTSASKPLTAKEKQKLLAASIKALKASGN